MDSDPNKKGDQKGKKPAIKIKQINIPENIRTLLNRRQGEGVGEGEGARAGPGVAAAAAAARS